MIKIGDNVRFLNDVGGGRVTKIDTKKNLVYVEDKDGFEIPVLANECVVVGEINKNTNFPRPTPKEQKSNSVVEPKKEVKIEQELEEEPIYETANGDELKVHLAFFPDNLKKLSDAEFECFLVNDSNYFVFYNFVIGLSNNRKSIANGIIEPNLQLFLTDLVATELNDWEKVTVQLIAFKRDKSYQVQRSIDFDLKFPVIKFHKMHSFVKNDYFDEPSILIDLVKESQKESLKNISADEIKKAMLTKEQKSEKKHTFKPQTKNEIIEVDLHITELLDTTVGMSSTDILTYQMDVFHKTIKQHEHHKGQKIVFIHGKGKGVLRNKITEQLKTKYKHLKHQDASFKEYSFGATMVII